MTQKPGGEGVSLTPRELMAKRLQPVRPGSPTGSDQFVEAKKRKKYLSMKNKVKSEAASRQERKHIMK